MLNNAQSRQILDSNTKNEQALQRRLHWSLASLVVLIISANFSELSAQQNEVKRPHRGAFRFDATTDQATAELKFVGQQAVAGRRQARPTRESSSFAQTVIRDRAVRNGSGDDFRRDVQRMESHGQAVYRGWYGQWFPQARRTFLGLPISLIGK